jgi:hypothetical protein
LGMGLWLKECLVFNVSHLKELLWEPI